jgi:hypothetical protein
MGCPREESFEEMFASIGNQELHNTIRRQTPDKKHCYLLRKSAMACNELPEAFDDLPLGSPCPNNPYIRNSDRLIHLERYQALIHRTIDLHRSFRARSLGHDDLHLEVLLAYTYDRWLEERAWQKR